MFENKQKAEGFWFKLTKKTESLESPIKWLL